MKPRFSDSKADAPRVAPVSVSLPVSRIPLGATLSKTTDAIHGTPAVVTRSVANRVPRANSCEVPERRYIERESNRRLSESLHAENRMKPVPDKCGASMPPCQIEIKSILQYFFSSLPFYFLLYSRRSSNFKTSKRSSAFDDIPMLLSY